MNTTFEHCLKWFNLKAQTTPINIVVATCDPKSYPINIMYNRARIFGQPYFDTKKIFITNQYNGAVWKGSKHNSS